MLCQDSCRSFLPRNHPAKPLLRWGSPPEGGARNRIRPNSPPSPHPLSVPAIGLWPLAPNGLKRPSRSPIALPESRSGARFTPFAASTPDQIKSRTRVLVSVTALAPRRATDAPSTQTRVPPKPQANRLERSSEIPSPSPGAMFSKSSSLPNQRHALSGGGAILQPPNLPRRGSGASGFEPAATTPIEKQPGAIPSANAAVGRWSFAWILIRGGGESSSSGRALAWLSTHRLSTASSSSCVAFGAEAEGPIDPTVSKTSFSP